MKFKIETLVKRRDALKKKLSRSQFNYGGNIAIPNSLRNQWDNWKFKIAYYNMRIEQALKESDVYKDYINARKAYGLDN